MFYGFPDDKTKKEYVLNILFKIAIKIYFSFRALRYFLAFDFTGSSLRYFFA